MEKYIIKGHQNDHTIRLARFVFLRIFAKLESDVLIPIPPIIRKANIISVNICAEKGKYFAFNMLLNMLFFVLFILTPGYFGNRTLIKY